MATEHAWIPCSGRDEAAGCVWLPRIVEKGRRKLAAELSNGDVMGEYFFGNNDFMDKQLLGFLNQSDEDLVATLRKEPDDGAAAREVVRRSGRTTEECATWNAQFLRRNAFNLAMFDADEGRRPPGLRTTILRKLYNRVLHPLFRWQYNRAQVKRQRTETLS